MRIYKATRRTRGLVQLLNKRYLNLNLRGIEFYEYEPDEGDFEVAWSNAPKKSVVLDPGALPLNPAYNAFILAHEVAHIRLGHKGGRRKAEQDEFDASTYARFVLAAKVGPKKARVLMQWWVTEWAGRLRKKPP